MKSIRFFASGLLLLAASSAASAHDVAGQPHLHVRGAPLYASNVLSAVLPLAVMAAAMLLSCVRRRPAGAHSH